MRDEEKAHKNGRIVVAACESWWINRFGSPMPVIDFRRLNLNPPCV